MAVISRVYGRRLGDFQTGQAFHHPCEVTLDEGVCSIFYASFAEASPIYRSEHFAKALGFNGRVVHPLLLMNFGLSFSVQDIFEQAVANLAWLNVHFPNPAYVGDTITAYSQVLSATPSKKKNRGTVHIQTTVVDQNNSPVCEFERIILVPEGKVQNELISWVGIIPMAMTQYPVLIDNLNFGSGAPTAAFDGFFENFRVGDILIHNPGRTVGESEQMRLATLFCNPHALHTDAVYCKTRSFAKRCIVDGGIAFSYVHALVSRDTGGQAIWTCGFDNGANPNPVLPGDTIRAAQKVIAKEAISKFIGKITFRLVGIKNEDPAKLLDQNIEIFKPEKSQKPISAKILEIDRTVLLRRKS